MVACSRVLGAYSRNPFKSYRDIIIASNAPIFRVQEHMTTVRRGCRSSRSNAPGLEIATEPKSETISRIALHWASSYWSDVMAEMTHLYKQNFKHRIPINYKASSKYSTVNEERSSKEKPDPVEAEHQEWRAQHFEELPPWRQGNLNRWHVKTPRHL